MYTSSKKVKNADYHICYICQEHEHTDYTNFISNPTSLSVDKLIASAALRLSYGEMEFTELHNRIKYMSTADLIHNGICYHKTCYKNLTHKTNIERAKIRYEKGERGEIESAVKAKGRPQKVSEESSQRPPGMRCETHDKERCVICQQDNQEILHSVSTKNMGAQLKAIGEHTDNKALKVRLANVMTSTDLLVAVAEDHKYHLSCLVKAKREIEKQTKTKNNSTFTLSQIVSDMEIIDLVETDINDSAVPHALNMNEIEQAYVALLKTNGVSVHHTKPQYKPYLKQLILANIPDVHFNRPPDKTKPEQVLSTKLKQSLLTTALANNAHETEDDIKILLKAAKILRRDIQNAPSWKFEGDFTNYQPPPLLYLFCKHTIQGQQHVKMTRKTGAFNQSASVLAQHFVTAYKSDRQVSYVSKSGECDFKRRTETPLTVGLALDIHKSTRSKSLVEKLGQLDLTIPYKKVLEIETAIANSVIDRMNLMGGIYQPPWLVNGQFVWFALDNIDFLESTPTGMNTLHGTATAVYQAAKEDTTTPITIDRKSASQTLESTIPCKTLTCMKPQTTNKKCFLKFNSYVAPSNPDLIDMAWIIGCLEFEDSGVTVRMDSSGTWSAFNSLQSTPGCKTNIALVPPLIRSPPTEYDTLFTSLMRARAIATHTMGPDAITVVTLDLQLYDMAMKLWVEREDIMKQFLFRPGELHIVFWALAALGKYVEGSGIDQAWVEAGLYSPATVSQILNGKHMYRALEAHTVTLVALYSLFFKQFLLSQPDEEVFLKDSSNLLSEAFQRDCAIDSADRNNVITAVRRTLNSFQSRNMSEKIREFEASGNRMQGFICNYMRQFLTILKFVRATRQRDLLLHLQSVELLMKYFFAHDHLNYARLLPLYIYSMQKTEQQQPHLWEELMQGNFCITKGEAGFTSIGPDHGIEQENRELKVIGGIVGITQNEKSLDKFFLIAPELSNVQHEFEQQFFHYGTNNTRSQHHELTGGKHSRIMNNALKLSTTFNNHGNPLEQSDADKDEIYNLLTKEVMSETTMSDILRRDAIGQEMFEAFVQERLIEGKLSVWDKMSKRKLQTFKSSNASAELKLGDKVIKIKEERGLLQRLIVITRSRPDLDLKDCIGTFEFGVIPRSLFASDGSLLLANDKASILHHLEKLDTIELNDSQFVDEINNLGVHDPTTENRFVDVRSNMNNDSPFRVLIIDGMALVNSIPKKPKIKTCLDFADEFIEILCSMTEGYNEVRLVFDRYVNSSLKEQMRTKRTNGKSTYYHVKDTTLIQNISLKDFLSDIRTKEELTTYLAEKVLQYSKSPNTNLQKIMVTSGTATRGNVDVPETLITHSQEEADTLIILHALNVVQDAKLIVSSPDTDIFLLLLNMYPRLPVSTSFLTGRGSAKRLINLQPIFHSLGPLRSTALLGFHAFTGSDVSGKFAGRTKDSAFKIFMTCDDNILRALAMLGNDGDLSDDIFSHLERFVCVLYRSKVHVKVNDLRWFLFSNRAAEGENLPPTYGSLVLHIRRAHFVTMIWKKAGISHPHLPSPTDFGWKYDEKHRLCPIHCMNPPAPDAVLHLVKCGCKCGCDKKCSCKKNNIPCTELCGCAMFICNNKSTVAFSESYDGDDDDD